MAAGRPAEPSPQEYLEGTCTGLDTYRRVREALARYEPLDVRVSVSQIALRRRHGFAYLWIPGRYLRHPTADVVLSIALGRHDPSARFKAVAHPSSRHWMHHLEITDSAQVDEQVAGWLREAADRAG